MEISSQSRHMSQLPAGTADPIVLQLHSVVQDSPDLSDAAQVYEITLQDAAQVYEIILPLLQNADLHVTPIAITADQARRKLEMGLPLLHDVTLELDAQAACKLMLQLAHALETTLDENWRPQLGLAARWIQLALEDEDLDCSALVSHVATGDNSH